ncbi:MAG TPA: extracellular solute-binding protein [Steroidobacteraceae bacterium]
MRARIVTVLTASALLVSCHSSEQPAARAAGEGATLYFSNWEGEIGPDTLAEFQRRTSIHVVMDDIPDNVSLQTRLLVGHSGSDVVVPSSNFLQPLIAAGAVQKLDKSRLTNWRHLDPAILAALAQIDPGNEYGVPFLWGTHAFAYNHDKVASALGREPEPSWSLMFDPENARRLASCGITWQDSAGSIMLDLGLLAIGRDPAGESLEDLNAVEAAFMRVRPYVRYIESGSRNRSDLASGDICITIGPNGEMLQARAMAIESGTGADIRYVVPREGALMWVDLLAIPAGAPHPDAAYRFLDYLLEPGVIAEVSNASQYANANRDAKQLIDAAVRDDPGIYPPAQEQLRLHLVPAESQTYTRARSAAWTRILTREASANAR